MKEYKFNKLKKISRIFSTKEREDDAAIIITRNIMRYAISKKKEKNMLFGKNQTRVSVI